jgi:ABC-2 type transport system permease protein
LLARNFDDVTWIATFILTPLVYLGGVFYPIEMLPTFWHNLSLFNPIFYVVNAFRYGILEISSVNPSSALITLLVLNVIAFTATCKMMNLGIGIRK